MMSACAIAMVKDEADIIESTVRWMAANVSEVYIADNGSSDGTDEIVTDLAFELGNVHLTHDEEPAYLQSQKMTRLAHEAHEWFDCEWVVPFDADEIWYCTAGRIEENLDDVGEGMMVATAQLFDHVATGEDPDIADPVDRIVWRRDQPLPMPKVACRWRGDLVIHQGNHGCDYGGVLPASTPLMVVRHFPYRSADQFVRKVVNGARAYRAAGDRLPSDVGAHWRRWGEIYERGGEEAVAEIFRTWFWREDPRRAVRINGERQGPLVWDPAPRNVRPILR